MLWKYSFFLRFSPWRESRIRHVVGYPFGTSRKKHQPFSITQPKEKNLYFHHTMKMKQSHSMAAPKKKPFPRPSPPRTQVRHTYPSYLQRISSLSRHWLQPPLKRTVLKKLKKETCGNATRPYSTSQRLKTHWHFLTCNHIGQKDMKSMLEFFRKTQHWSLIEDSKSRQVLEGIS